MFLKTQHPHPRDDRITFKEEGHEYTIEGFEGKPLSVTTLIHKRFPSFDADVVIGKMMRSPKWSSSPYFGMTEDEIKSKWDRERDDASSRGTLMHRAIELYFNGELPEADRPDTDEFRHFLKFHADLPKLLGEVQPYRTEWMVFAEDARLAGSIDMTLTNPQGEIIILDWKRSKEIKMSNSFERGYGAWRHLDSCNFIHYSLQLNIYKYMLENYYGKRVVDMNLVVLHPKQPSYQFIKVKDMQREVGKLFEELRAAVSRSSDSATPHADGTQVDGHQTISHEISHSRASSPLWQTPRQTIPPHLLKRASTTPTMSTTPTIGSDGLVVIR